MTTTKNFALAARTGLIHLTSQELHTENQTQVSKDCRGGTVRGYVVAARETREIWETWCPKCFPGRA